MGRCAVVCPTHVWTAVSEATVCPCARVAVASVCSCGLLPTLRPLLLSAVPPTFPYHRHRHRSLSRGHHCRVPFLQTRTLQGLSWELRMKTLLALRPWVF